MGDTDKITTGQLLKLFSCLCFSPAIRIIPVIEAHSAKQAGWLAPAFAFLLMLILILVFDRLFNLYDDISYTGIIYNSLGRHMGKVLLSIYVVHLSVLTAVYIRYYAAKLSIALATHMQMELNIIILLVLIYLVLRYGLVTLARMGEVIVVIINISFLVLFLLSIGDIKLDNLMPISYKDIIPLGKGGYYIMGIWSYFTLIFFLGNRIEDKQNFKNKSIRCSGFLAISTVGLSMMVIGSIGYSVVQRSLVPFFIAVKNISLMGIIERIEAVVVTQWIATDFILISVFIYIILDILKEILDTDDVGYLLKPLLIFFYIFSLYIAFSIFELQTFSLKFLTHMNLILCFVVPTLIYLISSVKKAKNQ
ncbi:MAG TPA: GerAB/ArcD/ProY family transporter [Clostridiales bacterium]|nr:GerAB/ArcD/ProY family transporter [Clostridiales bacterium]